MTELDNDSKFEVANFLIDICKYRHTVELMRWYGAFRSDGVYNSEGLLNIRELLKPLYKRDQDIKKVLSKGYPSAESLRKSKMAEMKKKKV